MMPNDRVRNRAGPARVVSPQAWRDYLVSFHSEHAGITEEVLRRSRSDGRNPYDWLVELVPTEGRVFDLACGSAPLASRCGSRWVGVDLSVAELAQARAHGAGLLVRGDAVALSFAGRTFDAIVCSMGLMLTQPLPAVLSEIARVLRRRGRLIALLPARRPLTMRDRVRYARLQLALARRLRYPNDALFQDLNVFRAAGLRVEADETASFAFHIDSPETASLLVDSLYVPGVDARHLQRAESVAQHWVGETVGVPLRRLVARADPAVPADET